MGRRTNRAGAGLFSGLSGLSGLSGPAGLTALAAAAVLAGCATGGRELAPGESSIGLSASAPAVAPADETFRGVRFGAARAELLRAYPEAQCKDAGCEGRAELLGLPAAFWVFQQPDGRWIARVSVADTSPAANATPKNFAQIEAGLRARFPQPPVVEQGGSQLRWKLGQDARRQVVLRRCPAQQECHGLPHTVVEVDFFEKETPSTAAW